MEEETHIQQEQQPMQTQPQGHEPEEEPEEELDVEEVAEEADTKVEALLELLIQKGIITQEEFDNKYEEFFEDEDDHAV